jgi:hypothetical protein
MSVDSFSGVAFPAMPGNSHPKLTAEQRALWTEYLAALERSHADGAWPQIVKAVGAQLETVEAILREMVLAYANVKSEDRDAMELRMFGAWLRAVNVLGFDAATITYRAVSEDYDESS